VNKLYRSIKRNTDLDFGFVCFTDQINNFEFDEAIEISSLLGLPDYLWNLRKMYVYYQDNGLSGQVFMIDLDVVITGDLSDILGYRGDFMTCRGAYKNKAGGSITSFPAGKWSDELWMSLVRNQKEIEQQTRGSERKYYQMKMGDIVEFWEDFFPGQILSYKRDCKDNPPSSMSRIVRFHGKPRPHEVKAEWITKNWV